MPGLASRAVLGLVNTHPTLGLPFAPSVYEMEEPAPAAAAAAAASADGSSVSPAGAGVRIGLCAVDCASGQVGNA